MIPVKMAGFFSHVCRLVVAHPTSSHDILVGGWALPLWKIWVSNSWDDDIPNSYGKSFKILVPNHQSDVFVVYGKSPFSMGKSTRNHQAAFVYPRTYLRGDKWGWCIGSDSLPTFDYVLLLGYKLVSNLIDTSFISINPNCKPSNY